LDTLIITSTPGMSSYEWMDGSNEDTLEFVASQFGTGIHYVTVMAYDSLGCFHEDTIVVAVADLVSINELTLELTVYPNPTTGLLQFSQENIDQVEIFTLEGKRLEQLTLIGGTVNLSEFQSGFYLLKITSSIGTQMIKILKQDL